MTLKNLVLIALGGAALCLAPLMLVRGFGRVPTCEIKLERQLKKQNVPGLAVAVIKNGRLVCAGAAGMANIDENIPTTPDTLFLVASISKTVTVTALMQLYEQGKFGLDDDINDYLPFDVRVPVAPEAPITFRELLTHTASIGDNGTYINCAGWCDYGTPLIPFVTKGADSPISLAEFTEGYFTPGANYYDKMRNFKQALPGTINDYANMGAVLAGYLVETISGLPFDTYTRDHIFAPLGMDMTGWRLSEIEPRRLAMPYDKRESKFVPYGQYGEVNYPDGMLRTSVIELAHFLAAYLQEGAYQGVEILQPKTVRQILKPQTPLDRDQGLFWYKDSIDERTVWGHDGSVNGASATMWFDPKRNEGVIIMANGVWEKGHELAARLFKLADVQSAAE